MGSLLDIILSIFEEQRTLFFIAVFASIFTGILLATVLTQTTKFFKKINYKINVILSTCYMFAFMMLILASVGGGMLPISYKEQQKTEKYVLIFSSLNKKYDIYTKKQKKELKELYENMDFTHKGIDVKIAHQVFRYRAKKILEKKENMVEE